LSTAGGSVRVVLASGEAGDEAVAKVKSANDSSASETVAIGMPSLSCYLFSVCHIFLVL